MTQPDWRLVIVVDVFNLKIILIKYLFLHYKPLRQYINIFCNLSLKFPSGVILKKNMISLSFNIKTATKVEVRAIQDHKVIK